jgi:hypothetical protein
MKYVWLVGGYFNGSCYGRFKEEHLPGDDILMHHYDNPRAKMQGVTILGITQKGPDDITIVENYKRSHEAGESNIYYTCEGEVDPGKVEMVDGELRWKDGGLTLEDELEMDC